MVGCGGHETVKIDLHHHGALLIDIFHRGETMILNELEHAVPIQLNIKHANKPIAKANLTTKVLASEQATHNEGRTS